MPAWPKIVRHRHVITPRDEGEPEREVLLASAALINREHVNATLNTAGADWQREAWELYDACPELRFGMDWLGNCCSRVNLFTGRVDPDGSTDPARIDSDDPEFPTVGAPLAELFGPGSAGQAEMIRRLVVHLSIPGESYLAGWMDPDDPPGSPRRWMVLSRDEVTPVMYGKGDAQIMLPDRAEKATLYLGGNRDALIRLWRPHPRVAILPDSQMIPLRATLREILSLSAHIAACGDSRLAGAGILGVPDELTTVDERQSDGVNPVHGDPLTNALITAAAASLKDRDSASALVPIVVRGPGEQLKNLVHLTFATPFDDKVLPIRDAAIRRVANGMSLPAEIVLGLGGGGSGNSPNHWSAYVINDQALSTSIAPIMGLLCQALTIQFQRPALADTEGVNNPQLYAIGYDMTLLSQRPNRGPEAQAAWDRLTISDAALNRELGFDEADAPDAEERKRRIVEKLIAANATLAPLLLPYLGITPMETGYPVTVAGQVLSSRGDGSGAPRQIAAPTIADSAITGEPPAGDGADGPRAAPAGPTETVTAAGELAAAAVSAQDHPDQFLSVQAADHIATALLSESDRADTAELTAATWRNTALEIGVLRALDRAGNWLIGAYGRSYRSQLAEVPLREIHTRLACEESWLPLMFKNGDGFEELVAAVPDRPCLTDTVIRYVHALLVTGTPHERSYLDEVVTAADCTGAQPEVAHAA